MLMSWVYFAGGGFWLVVTAIILIALVLTLRDKGADGLAIFSLVSGILGFFFWPIFGSILAIVTGNIAQSRIRMVAQTTMAAQPGSYNAIARAGVVLGWLGLAIWVIGGLLILLFLVPVTVVTTGG